ncbi:protein-disulfide reductase DsbD [Oceaniovalibus sp. ACAM 378]|uniref:protein-disulfide reductase DsbD n=1 Tax=Oceaniovalibus sp. ACAM 378 TaxID=2599923 RepID=UPI0011D7ED4E|nr:protein-disulfide reductase DsbD [Oceaniovalibus sp. ACAM 378]TYB84269.1 protein-disulfide reductase DsbD [Oceaniovalibus sp. ACAM 378]
MSRATEPFRRAVRSIVTAMTVLFIVMSAWPATAQLLTGSGNAPLPASDAFQISVADQDDGTRILSWDIADGYYLYRDKLAADTADGIAVPLQTGPGKEMDDLTFGAVEVYFDTARAVMGAVNGPVTVTWQGCQDGGICYPPVKQTLTALDGATSPVSAAPAAEKIVLAQEQGLIDSLRARGGTLLVLAGFLGFGLLLAFTPCVFPMFPILAGLLSRQGDTLTARRGAALSGVYVLAMASAFGLLGIAAAWSGQNLQMVLQSPAAIYGVAAIFVALALSMFGLFELQLPQAWTRRLSSAGSGRRGTFGGAAVLGFTSALIVGPCVTAPLAGALLYIAGTGDLMLGAGALFALGLGQGIPLLIAGTLGARVLPRAGAWMDGVKRLFGFVFLGMAIWLIGRLVPGPAILALWAGLLVSAGIFSGAMDLLPGDAGSARRGIKSVGVLSLIAGAIMAVGAALGGSDPLRPFATLQGVAGKAGATTGTVEFDTVINASALDAAISAKPGVPAMIYVTADWCVTCRVIERNVWPDAGVQAALSGLNVIAADVSDFDAEGQEMLERLGAVGPPTMVFLDRNRTEAPGTRIVGDTGADAVQKSAEVIR